jgi:hypothetical protein
MESDGKVSKRSVIGVILRLDLNCFSLIAILALLALLNRPSGNEPESKHFEPLRYPKEISYTNCNALPK